MSFESILRALKGRPGDLTRLIPIKTQEEIRHAQTHRVVLSSTKPNITFVTSYPTWDEENQTELFIPVQRTKHQLAMQAAKNLPHDSRPSIPRFSYTPSKEEENEMAPSVVATPFVKAAVVDIDEESEATSVLFQPTNASTNIIAEESTNIFGGYSICSVAPQRAASRPLESVVLPLSPLKVNTGTVCNTEAASRPTAGCRDTALRHATTTCRTFGFRPLATPPNNAVDLACLALDIHANYLTVGGVVMTDLLGNQQPELRMGKVRIGSDFYTFTRCHTDPATQRTAYLGTQDGVENCFAVAYQWASGDSLEAARAHVAYQSLHAAASVRGYRTHDKSSGYTTVLLPFEVRPLADFLTPTAPPEAVDTVFFDVLGALRTMCSRRIVHTALSADTILVGVSDTALVVLPIMWDLCIDGAMFVDRKAKFLPSHDVRSVYGVNVIDGCKVDLLAAVRMLRLGSAACMSASEGLAKKPAATMTFSIAQGGFAYQLDAVQQYLRTIS